MIKEIAITGFQSLVGVRLALGKLTVIVGNTNQGKSAVMRALRTMVENRRGDNVINDDMDECTVSILFDNSLVTWMKERKKTGQYWTDGQASNYEIAIRQKLKITEVKLNKTYSVWPNFQDQLAAPFLLAESDSQKSRVLGEITNANLLILAASTIKKQISETRNKLEWRESELITTRVKIDSFHSVKTLSIILKAIKAFIDDIVKNVGTYDRWMVLGEDLWTAICAHNKLKNRWNILGGYRAKLEAVMPNQILLNQLLELERYIDRIEVERKIAKKLDRKIKLRSMFPDFASVEKRMFEVETLTGYVIAIADVEKIISTHSTLAKGTEEELISLDNEIEKFKEFAKFCPLCEQPLEMTHAHSNNE